MTNLQDFTNRSEVGTIKPWGKATAPNGYLLCDGSAVSRTDYAELFTVLSTTYGAGNGSTTFNVPQLQGKTPQGYDGNTYNLAATGGANTVTVAMTNNQAVSTITATVANNQSVTMTGDIGTTSLTTAQLASHTHTLLLRGGPSGSGRLQSSQGRFNYYASGSEGSGTAHNHGTGTLAGTLTGTVAVTNSGEL